MRTIASRLVLAAALLTAGLGTTSAASAAYDPTDEVTVTYNPFVVCVTDPCPQPVPVTVCVERLAYCTPE